MKIIIDISKCIRCMKCISECPTRSICFIDSYVRQTTHDYCLSCGHCAAVCTQNAISCDANSTTRSFLLIDFSSNRSEDTTIFQRTRSIRRFKSESIDKTIINKLISDAEMAPSADNFRNREYIVVNSFDEINKIEHLLYIHFNRIVTLLPSLVVKLLSVYSKTLAAEIKFISKCIKSYKARNLEMEHLIFRGAPCVIFIVGPHKSLFAKDDCIAAQNYMRLSGTIMGIGSCIIGFAQKSNGILEKYLRLDRTKVIYAATIFGYQSNEFIKCIEYPKPSIQWI